MRVSAIILAFALTGTALAASPQGSPGPHRIQTVNGVRDVIQCGAGRDIVVADQKDVVAADCELLTRRIAVDIGTSSSGQHRTVVEPSAVGDGSTVVAVFQSGRIVDGGSAAIGWATSTDGGVTFRHGLLPDSGAPRVSDPVVARDRAHGMWIAAVLAVLPAETQLQIYRSPDGLNWSSPVVAATATLPPETPIGFDKEWVACDNRLASPRQGTCYLAYSDLNASTLGLRTSQDGGATWGAATELGPQGDDAPIGAAPAIATDGAVVVVYATGTLDAIEAATSHDGGATFGPPARIASIASHPAPLRAPALPSVAETSTGISVVWPDCAAHPDCTSNDIVASESSDGATWSAQHAIASGGDYLTPTIGAVGDAAAVVAYVRQPGPCCRLGIRLFRSANGGATWSPPARLDAQPMDSAWFARSLNGSDTTGFLGDYMAVAFVGSRPVPVYAAALPPRGETLRQDLYATTRLP